MGRDDYSKQIDEELENALENGQNFPNGDQQQYQPGYFHSNVGAPYGSIYTQVPNNNEQQQQQQPPYAINQYFDDGQNYATYYYKDGQYIPTNPNQNFNESKQPIMPPVIVYPLTTFKDRDHTIPALLLFITGFFFYIPWAVNCLYIRSENRIARTFASISLLLFFSVIIVSICIFVFIVYIAEEVENQSSSQHTDSSF